MSSRSRRNASRADAARAAAAELHAALAGNKDISVAEEAPVFDKVDEEQYAEIVKKRREEAGELISTSRQRHVPTWKRMRRALWLYFHIFAPRFVPTLLTCPTNQPLCVCESLSRHALLWRAFAGAWIVDDDGRGYADIGEEDWGADPQEEAEAAQVSMACSAYDPFQRHRLALASSGAVLRGFLSNPSHVSSRAVSLRLSARKEPDSIDNRGSYAGQQEETWC